MIRREPQTKDTERAHKALNELILDCFKKVREFENKRRRAVAREELSGEEQSGGDLKSDEESQPTKKKQRVQAGKPLVMFVLDVGNTAHRDPFTNAWNWELPGKKKMAVLNEVTINELHRKISPHLLEGRKVREIIGVLTNSQPGEGVAPSDVTHIRSDEDLNALLQLTQVKPIKLLMM